MTELTKSLGISTNYGMLAGTGTERVIGVALTPGSGILARGTILAKQATGLFAPLATGSAASAMCAVLIDTTDTGTETAGIAQSASAYDKGRFQGDKIFLASGELTDADKLALRTQGIDIAEIGTLNNEVTAGENDGN